MDTLPQAELEVMQVLWGAKPPLNSRTVVNAMEEKHGWKIQTVSTLLTRLTKRGFLATSRSGREVHYQILIPRDDYMAVETADFLDKYRGSSLSGLIAAFVENDPLSDEDVRDLSAWLDVQKKERG